MKRRSQRNRCKQSLGRHVCVWTGRETFKVNLMSTEGSPFIMKMAYATYTLIFQDLMTRCLILLKSLQINHLINPLQFFLKSTSIFFRYWCKSYTHCFIFYVRSHVLCIHVFLTFLHCGCTHPCALCAPRFVTYSESINRMLKKCWRWKKIWLCFAIFASKSDSQETQSNLSRHLQKKAMNVICRLSS